MKVRILASAPDRSGLDYLTTFLVNGTVAIDAGCLGFFGPPVEQAKVAHVFVTHSHADHICSLPMFAMNVNEHAGRGIVVRSHEHVIETLRADVFNGRVWPNFLRILDNGVPIVQLERIAPGVPLDVGGLRITPVLVNHSVPTTAYLVDDGHSAVVFSTDSGPTEEIWAQCRALSHFKAVFLGVAFPNEMASLAEMAGHLTPALVPAEVAKMPPQTRVVVIHIKAAHRARVLEELDALGLANVSIGSSVGEYEF